MVFLMILAALFPLIFLMVIGNRQRMEMFYEHKSMEREILRVIPVGSNAQYAKRVMEQNGFICSKQSGQGLEFRKETKWWEISNKSIVWTVYMDTKNNNITNAKVWIDPL